MRTDLLDEVKKLKAKYEPEGFIILGVFGSYARGDETEGSDIDILYNLTKDFTVAYDGFDAFKRLAEIREELKLALRKDIDIVDESGLDRVGEKYILPEVVYVGE
jgi:predicted nucleotidyltransferase